MIDLSNKATEQRITALRAFLRLADYTRMNLTETHLRAAGRETALQRWAVEKAAAEKALDDLPYWDQRNWAERVLALCQGLEVLPAVAAQHATTVALAQRKAQFRASLKLTVSLTEYLESLVEFTAKLMSATWVDLPAGTCALVMCRSKSGVPTLLQVVLRTSPTGNVDVEKVLDVEAQTWIE